jgi:hypothetical protein
MVRKVGRSRCCEAIPEGLRAITTLLVPREKVIRNFAGRSQQPQSQSTLNNPTPIDHHYQHLRVTMHKLERFSIGHLNKFMGDRNEDKRLLKIIEFLERPGS